MNTSATKEHLTRRQFLKLVGMAAGGLLAEHYLGGLAHAQGPEETATFQQGQINGVGFGRELLPTERIEVWRAKPLGTENVPGATGYRTFSYNNAYYEIPSDGQGGIASAEQSGGFIDGVETVTTPDGQVILNSETLNQRLNTPGEYVIGVTREIGPNQRVLIDAKFVGITPAPTDKSKSNDGGSTGNSGNGLGDPPPDDWPVL